jgi:hypothetical protein
MGCDYYIYVYFEIEHTRGIAYYEFPIIRGYYPELECGIWDSDNEEEDYYYNSPEYCAMYESMKKICLTPRKPVIIYENHAFVSPKFETKYLDIIQTKIKQINRVKYSRIKEIGGTLTSIEQVIKITKKEDRYDPYYTGV